MLDHKAIVVKLSIFPHNNADKLEIAKVNDWDWNIVVGKGIYKTGDLAVYIPVDSLLDQNFYDEYLSKSKITMSKVGDKYKVKTVKIRGVISQGLVIPAKENMKLGDDVTKELRIVKYEPEDPSFSNPANKIQIVKKDSKYKKVVNSIFREYTDIQNFKYYPNLIKDGEHVVLLEKIHGTNTRICIIRDNCFPKTLLQKIRLFFSKFFSKENKKWQLFVGSHHKVIYNEKDTSNWYKDNVYWGAAYKSSLASNYNEVTDSICDYIKSRPCYNVFHESDIIGITFFGEVFGSKIQDLEYGYKNGERGFFVFDISYIRKDGTRGFLNWSDVGVICSMLRIHTVPELWIGKWNSGLVDYAKGKTTVPNANHIREGFVVKPTVERYDNHLGRVILKCINDEYLLKENRTEYH